MDNGFVAAIHRLISLGDHGCSSYRAGFGYVPCIGQRVDWCRMAHWLHCCAAVRIGNCASVMICVADASIA